MRFFTHHRPSLRIASAFGIALALVSVAGPEAAAQCTGTLMGGTAAVPAGNWSPATVPPTQSVNLNMTTTAGSNLATITGCNATLIANLAAISGPNVPGGTSISGGVCGANAVQLSANATVTGAAIHTFTIPAYGSNVPPANQGIPAGITCSVCPSTFTASICANQFVQFYACAGNVYTISMCASAPASDFTLSVTNSDAGFTAVPVGYFGSTFDNDGCGTGNGPSTLTFSPQTSGTFRARVFQDPCVVNTLLCGTISISCSIPTPPPNDVACNAIALPVPTACSYQLADASWGNTETGIPAPGCGAYFGRDSWYSAVVPASGNLRIQTTLVSANSLGMAVYTAPACNAPQINWSVVLCSPGPSPLLDVSGLVTPNTTVYIRVWPNSNIGNMGTFNICAFEPTPPFNDLPCGAFNLPTPAVCAPNTYTTEFATNNIPLGITADPPGCGGAINNDVWFAVTVPPTGAFTINTFAGSMSDLAMAWYRLNTGGSLCNPPGFAGNLTLIACNDDQFAPTNLMPRINSQTTAPAITPALVAGETIYVRIWPKGAANTPATNGTFSICATENVPPPNDEACGAIPLPTSLSCNLIPTTNEGASTNNAYPVPPCGVPVQNDVWYTFTVPPNGQIEFNTQAVGLTDAAFALYESSGGCAPANLTLVTAPNCQVGGSSFGALMPQQLFAGLSTGTTYYLRVWRQGGNVGPFNICARQTAAAPISGCDLNSSDSGGPLGNYGNNEVYEQTFCPVNPGDVVAIDFTAFSTQANNDFLTVYNGPSTASPVLGVFSGGTLPPGLVSTAVGGCLTIRFTSNASVVSSGWVISVSCGPPLPPIPAAPAPCNTTIYDSGGASGNYTNNEFVTQTYCPPTPGEVVTLTFTQFALEQNWDFLTVFNGPTVGAPSLGTFTGTNNPGSFTSTHPSGCLTIRFTSDASIVTPGYAATIRCGLPQPPPPPPPPPSGICGTTVYDPGGPNGNYFNATNQNPSNFGGNNCWPYTCLGAGATAPPGQPLWSQTYCPTVAGDAVTLTFNSFNVENGWDNVYIYNGPVVSPNNANGTQFLSGSGLPTCGGIAGWCNQTLGAGGFSGTANPGSFTSTHPSGCLTIAMTSDDIVTLAGWEATISCQSGFDPGADCIYALRLYDSYGDGWAGSTLTVVVNGGTPTTYTIQTGTFQQVLLSFDNGDNVQITYNGAGYFPGDNYWTLDLVGTEYSLYHSAIPAVSGPQSFTINCALPIGPPQEDCPGAQILCNTNPVTVQTNNFGSIGDLTPANNGCLSINERQGEWFVFRAGAVTPSLGFSIAPTGSADINWAIWGPYSVALTVDQMCDAMTAPPIRCSFATAASTFAATGSYNTGMGSPTYSAPQFNPAATPTSQGAGGNGWVPGLTATPGDVYILYVSNFTQNGTPATLTWTNGTLDCFLPVELLSFDAKALEDEVEVHWSTASEVNSAWFMVQRSADNETFETIGRVQARGTVSSQTDYAFTDRSPLPGLSYYRLEQVDLDGTVTYTHSVPVRFKPAGATLQLYPNPVREELNLLFEASVGTVHWLVLDASGRTALHGNAGASDGPQQLVLPTGALESGAYLLILTQEGNELGRRRFVKH